MKTYQIGGKEFQLRPLTQRQRYMANPFERKMREIMIKIASVSESTPGSLQQVFDISLQMDQLVYSEDEALQKFLATILTPADAEKWTPAMIDLNKDLMWEITEDIQAEVLADLFGRATNSPISSPVSIKNSTNEKKQSGISESQKDSEKSTS